MTNLALTIERGRTFGQVTIVAKTSAGAVQNLTGYAVYAEIRATPTAVLINLAPTITNAAAGEIKTSEIPYATTLALAEQNAHWDLVLQAPSGARLGQLIGGGVSIITPVTQPV